MTKEIDAWNGWPRCGYCKSLVNRDSMRCPDEDCPGRNREWNGGLESATKRGGPQ